MAPIAIVVLLLLAAAVLRLPSLTLNSFWFDELFSINVALAPVQKKLNFLIFDTHPPTFNILVSLWTLVFGKSEFALRMFPALIGIITVPITFVVFKKSFNTITGLATAILVLFLPAHIYYSQELRPYILAFLFTTISTASLFRYLVNPTAYHRWELAASCTMLVAMHYIGIFYVVTLLAFAAIGIEANWQTKLEKTIHLTLSTCVLMYPFLLHLIAKRLTMDSWWPSPVTPERVLNTILFLFQGQALLALIYLLLALVAILIALRKENRPSSLKVWALSALSIFPLAGVIAVSLISPNVTIFIPRIIVIFAPAIIILVAVGLTSIPHKIFTSGMLVFCSIVSLWWLYNGSYYTMPTKSDFRGIAQEIAKLEKKHGSLLLVSVDHPVVTKGHDYYFDMFGVRSKIFPLPDNLSAHELLPYIRTAAGRGNINKIVLFSAHGFFRADIVEVFDANFPREYEKNFFGLPHRKSGKTFLAGYSLH